MSRESRYDKECAPHGANTRDKFRGCTMGSIVMSDYFWGSGSSDLSLALVLDIQRQGQEQLRYILLPVAPGHQPVAAPQTK